MQSIESIYTCRLFNTYYYTVVVITDNCEVSQTGWVSFQLSQFVTVGFIYFVNQFQTELQDQQFFIVNQVKYRTVVAIYSLPSYKMELIYVQFCQVLFILLTNFRQNCPIGYRQFLFRIAGSNQSNDSLTPKKSLLENQFKSL